MKDVYEHLSTSASHERIHVISNRGTVGRSMHNSPLTENALTKVQRKRVYSFIYSFNTKNAEGTIY